MTDVRVVLMTAPDEDTAAAITTTLLDERLVACGNLTASVRSIFRWEGSVEDDSEILVVLKTSGARVDALLRRIPDLHPYDVPEVLVLGVEAGHPEYLRWVVAESAAPDETD